MSRSTPDPDDKPKKAFICPYEREITNAAHRHGPAVSILVGVITLLIVASKF
jgi:hypothetical protein